MYFFPSWASVAGGVGRPRSEAPCISYNTCSVSALRCSSFCRAVFLFTAHSFWRQFCQTQCGIDARSCNVDTTTTTTTTVLYQVSCNSSTSDAFVQRGLLVVPEQWRHYFRLFSDARSRSCVVAGNNMLQLYGNLVHKPYHGIYTRSVLVWSSPSGALCTI